MEPSGGVRATEPAKKNYLLTTGQWEAIQVLKYTSTQSTLARESGGMPPSPEGK